MGQDIEPGRRAAGVTRWQRIDWLRQLLHIAARESAPPRTDVALIKAIARGYSWYEKLISGKTVSVEALAAEVGMNKRYVNRVIRCALLVNERGQAFTL